MAKVNGMADVSTTSALLAVTERPTDQAVAFPQIQHSTDVAAFMPVMSMEVALQRWDSIRQFISRIMTPDEDYGTIAGGKKPTLLKPGAEKLTAFFGLVPTFEVTARVEDWEGERFNGEPFFAYEITCRLLRDGVVRGEGLGSCNSREIKYRYRESERKCPSCGSPAIIKGKAEYGGGWLCFRKKGGCGATFADGDRKIEGQTQGRIPNPDVADLANTLLKMARKRAHVDAVLATTGASQFFGQDEPAAPSPAPEPPPARQPEPEPPAPRQTRRAPAPAAVSTIDADAIDIGGNPPNSKAAAAYVRDRKLRELKASVITPWKTFGEFLALMALLRERVGEVAYQTELEALGLADARELLNRNDRATAIALYNRLEAIYREAQ